MYMSALLVLCVVALFGGYILLRRTQKKPARRWMALGHGMGAVVGLVVLVVGVLELYFDDALNSWVLLGFALISGVVFGGFLLFEKLLKGKRKPVFILATHGVLAVVSLAVLAYSFSI